MRAQSHHPVHTAPELSSATVLGFNLATVLGFNLATVLGFNLATVLGCHLATVLGFNLATVLGCNPAIVLGRNLATVLGRNLATVLGFNQATVLGFNLATVLGFNLATVLGFNQATVLGFNQATVLGRNLATVPGCKLCNVTQPVAVSPAPAGPHLLTEVRRATRRSVSQPCSGLIQSSQCRGSLSSCSQPYIRHSASDGGKVGTPTNKPSALEPSGGLKVTIDYIHPGDPTIISRR